MLNTYPTLLLEINKKEQLEIKDVSFVVGYSNYSAFAGIYLTYEEIKNLENKENIFILINALIHQKDFEDFKETALTLIKLGFNFIIQDIGALSFIYKIPLLYRYHLEINLLCYLFLIKAFCP